MKTLKELIDTSKLAENIVKSELNAGRSVYLIQNKRTEQSLLASNLIGTIVGDGGGVWGDTYTQPLDQVDTVSQLV